MLRLGGRHRLRESITGATMMNRKQLSDRDHLNQFLAAESKMRLLLSRRLESSFDEALAREALALGQIAKRTWSKNASSILRAAADFIDSGDAS